VNMFIAAHPRQFLRVDGPGNLEQAKAEGRIGIVIGQQNPPTFDVSRMSIVFTVWDNGFPSSPTAATRSAAARATREMTV